MKIFLIFLDLNSFHKNDYHFGLAYISSALKKNNHQVRYMYFSSMEEEGSLVDQIKDFSPDIVGFSAVETQFIYIERLAKLIKEVHSCFIVCGGVHVTLFPESVKEAPSLDGVIMGEGEVAILELVKNLEHGAGFRDTPNFCYFNKGQRRLVKNKLLPLLEELDTLGYPDRDILDYTSFIKRQGFIYFIFNRGCPYRCAYCSNHALSKTYGNPRNYIRFRSPDHCLSEIEEVLTRFGSNYPLYFLDDIFTLKLPWLYEFLDKYAKSFKKRPFMCHTRSNLASQELFKRLRGAGCYRVMMSIESGNDFIRNEVMQRGISRKQLYDSFRWAQENDLETNGVSVIGLPYETRETITETIKTAAEVDATSVGTNIFYPYRGTKLYDLCKREKFLREEDLKRNICERREAVLNLPTITKDEIEYFYRHFENLVLGFKPLRYRIKAKIRRTFSRHFRENQSWKIIKNTPAVRNLRKLVKI